MSEPVSWQGHRPDPSEPRLRSVRGGVCSPERAPLEVLAGELAHDFNNILTSILGSAYLGLGELPEDSPGAACLERIRRSVDRATAITDRLLACSDSAPLELETVDLSELSQRQAARAHGVRVDLAPGLALVEGSPSQLGLALDELIANAVESSEGRAEVGVRTGSALRGTGRAGVFVEVWDRGSGMADPVSERIFEPFYTTKTGHIGLGLAAVAGVLRAHRGEVQVHTKPGGGSRVRLILPPNHCPSA